MKIKASTCFFVISVLAVIGAIVMFIMHEASYSNTSKVEATITQVKAEIDKKGNRTHTIYLNYRVNNQLYTAKTTKYKGKANTDDKIIIFYKNDNPADLVFDYSNTGGLILIGVSVVLAGVGFIYKKKKN